MQRTTLAGASVRSLSVLIVSSGGAARPGGVLTDIRQTAEGLKRFGHRVRVTVSAREAARALSSGQVDIVHVFGCLPSPSPFATMLLTRSTGTRLVWTPVFHPSRRGSWKGYGLLRSMEAFDLVAPLAARLADAVVAMTEAEAGFFRGLGAKNVECIPPGVLPHEPVDAAKLGAFRARFGLGPGGVVLVVARESSRKGLPFGLAAFRELRNHLKDSQLLLVGADPATWSRHEGVRCTGWLEGSEMEMVYAVADVVFVPSLYESFCRAVIEAWSSGLPVVATDRVGLAPVIEKGGGRIVPFGDVRAAADALELMISDPGLALACGSHGRALVDQRFSLHDVEDQIEALYMNLASRGSR
jgi:glycosyltransferase involved in cell wall biosynthesis